MKKIVILISVVFCSVFALKAQCPIEVGQMQINAGFGLSNYGIPVYAGLDYGLQPDITLGGEVSFRNYKENFFGTNYGHSIYGFCINGNYHFNTIIGIPDNYDFYAGVNIGFVVWKSPSKYGGNQTSGLGLGLQVGGRYYFNEKFGLQLELGGGNRFGDGKFGISIRL